MDSRFSRALLLGAALFLYVPKLFVALTEHAGRWGADYYAFYWAAYYTFNLRRSPFGDQAFAAIPTDTGLPIREFVYPAPSLLFFYPLSWFSEWGGGLAIFLLSQTCILLLLFLLVRELAAPRTGDTTGLMCATAIVVYFLNFDAIESTIGNTQLNLIIALLIALSWSALRQNKAPWQSAVPLPAAMILKVYPVLLNGQAIQHERRA